MKSQKCTNPVGLLVCVLMLASIPFLSGCATLGKPQAPPAGCEHSMLAKTAPWSDVVLNTQQWCSTRELIETNQFCPMVRLKKEITGAPG